MAFFSSGRRIKAVVGHYGSGKTEISLNMAVALAKEYDETALVDLDIVNPFFRSAEQRQMLERAGVEVLSTAFAVTAADIPALPPEILSVFARPNLRCVMDIGGDDAGSAALGTYKPHLDACGVDVYYVVNPFRPRSSNREQVLNMLSKIGVRARQRVTGFVLNANLGDETTPETLMAGRALFEPIAREAGLPILAEAGPAAALTKTDGRYERFPIRRYLKPDWMDQNP